MTHKRKQIKQRVKELVSEALNGIVLPQNIRIQSTMPVQDDALPACHIYIRSEDTVLFSESPRELDRQAELLVELFAKANSGELLDDFLDDTSLLVENKLGAGTSETLQYIDSETEEEIDLVDDLILIKTEIDADYNGKFPMGAVRMVFQVRTVLPTNTVIEETDLNEIQAKWKISESDPDNAVDRLIYT